MVPINYETKRASDEERNYLFDEVPTSFLEAFGANFSLLTDYNPAWGLYREARRKKAGEDDNEIIPVGKLNEKYANLGLFFDKDEPRGYVNLLVEKKKDELKKQNIVQRGPQNIFAKSSYFISGLGASFLDPINLGAAFIPVVGQARFLSNVARYGVTRSRMLKGVQEGFVGNVAVEPLSYISANQEQRDYTAANAITNVAFGSILGGGMHVTFGKIGDMYKKYTGKENIYTKIANADPALREDLLKYTIGQLVQNKRPNIAAFLDMTKIAKETDLEANINLSRDPRTAKQLFDTRKIIINDLKKELNLENELIKKQLDILKKQNIEIYKKARNANKRNKKKVEQEVKDKNPNASMEEIYRERDRILAERSNKKIEPILKKIRELEAREKIIIENTINESKLIQNTFQISNPLNKKLFIQRSKLQNINDKIETLKLRDGRKLLEETSLKDEAVNTTVVNKERLRTKTNPAEGEDLEIIPEDTSPKMNPENITEVNDNIKILKEQTDVIDPKILEESPFIKDYISAVNKEINVIEKITTREEDLNKSVKAGLSCLVKKG
tara:strand:+ start:2613 stop:4286 length:1674 start_codon:yes stop_codon:yes gene_type:complete